MMNKILFSVLIFSFLILMPQLSKVAAATSNNSVIEEVEARQIDRKAEILRQYLAKYDSPLQYYAQDFIDAANAYSLDWKLVPAIAGVESTFGKFIPGGYNGWGWGVYGTQAIFFNSWKEAIFTISKGLRENYLNKGYTDPYSINKIYAASTSWGSHVTYFMEDLDKFASQFPEEKKEISNISSDPKIAAVSGQPVIR